MRKNLFLFSLVLLFISNLSAQEVKFVEYDLDNGELEIGQIAGLIHEIKPAKTILNEIVDEFNRVKYLISKV